MSPQEHKHALPRYASGGYPIVYFTRRGEPLCAACASSQEHGEPVGQAIHWEGEPIECEGCGEVIQSAYGPVDP